MDKNLSLSGRLQALIDHYGLNPNQLAKKLGGSRMKYYNLLDGTSKPDFATTEAILNQFPEISAEWLMRGNGPMFKEEIVSKEQFEGLVAENNALQVMYEKAVISKAASLGKSEGATLCPDTKKGLLIKDGRMVIGTARRLSIRRSSRKVSVRVPGDLIVPGLKELFGRPL